MKKPILILLIATSAYLGYRVGNGNNFFFDFIKLGICALIFLGFTVIVGIIDIIIKKRFFIYPGFVLLLFLILIGVSIINFKIKSNEKQEMANHIIIELDKYKIETNHYPNTLETLTNINDTDIHYSLDDNRQNYHLYYDYDGWQIMNYNSKTKQWQMID